MTKIEPIAFAQDLLLFGNVPTETKTVEVQHFKPGRFQARKSFDETALIELAASIKELGRNLVPIYARPTTGGNYEIIAGERRWRATQIAGLPAVVSIIGNFSDYQCRIITLIENIQREDINAYEEAVSIRDLAEDCDLSQEEVALRIGKSRSHTGNLLRLLDADAVLQAYVRNGDLLFTQARPLLAISDPYQQAALARKAVSKQLSSRQIEALVSGTRKEKPKRKGKNLDVSRFETMISESSGHPCTITQKPSGKGTLQFEWASPEDLENLLENLRNLDLSKS